MSNKLKKAVATTIWGVSITLPIVVASYLILTIFRTRKKTESPFYLLIGRTRTTSFHLDRVSTHTAMARFALASSVVLLLLFCCAAAGSVFDDSNPIRLVSDGLRDLESSVLQVIGHTRHALSFARFTHR